MIRNAFGEDIYIHTVKQRQIARKLGPQVVVSRQTTFRSVALDEMWNRICTFYLKALPECNENNVCLNCLKMEMQTFSFVVKGPLRHFFGR